MGKSIRRMIPLACSMLFAAPAGADPCKPATSVSYHAGGRILTNPQVQVIYWGTAWAGTGPNPSWRQINGALNDISNGPFFFSLREYDYAQSTHQPVGPVHLLPSVDLITDSDPGSAGKFSDANITSKIESEIAAGNVPLPNNNIDMIYAVIVPPGFTSSSHGALGFHSFKTYSGNNNTYYWTWIRSPGPITRWDSAPSTFDHEIGEAATNPQGTAWFGPDGEIGDPCGSCTPTVNGYTVQSLWSQKFQRCIAPRAWHGVFQNTGNNNWNLIGGDVQQVNAGGFGLVATDNVDPLATLWRWDSVNGWHNTGGQGSNFAVSNTTAYAVSMDQQSTWRFNSGTSWTSLSSAGENAVFAGGTDNMYVTQNPSQSRTSVLWKWSGGQQWTRVYSAPVANVVANEKDTYISTVLSGGTTQVIKLSNGVVIAGGNQDIFGGPGMVSAIASAGNLRGYIYDWQESASKWWQNQGPWFQAVVSGTAQAPQLFILGVNSTQPQAFGFSNNVYATMPLATAWSTNGVGRLVGGAASVFATGDPACSTTPNATCP